MEKDHEDATEDHLVKKRKRDDSEEEVEPARNENEGSSPRPYDVHL